MVCHCWKMCSYFLFEHENPGISRICSQLGSQFMRIATWNVNSIRQRLDLLLTWLKECSPDIVCLQEIKCVDEAFPRLEIEALGYNVVTHGQKTFNGVDRKSVV